MKINGTWGSTLAASNVLSGVSTRSWLYAAAGTESASSVSPATNTTEFTGGDVTNATGPTDAAVGANTTGTSGDITVGWTTTTTYGARAAVEILEATYSGFSAKVITGTDDAQETGAGAVTNNGVTIGGSLDATDEQIGMRFQSVTIPNGATINSARLVVVPSSSSEDEPLVTVYMEASDDCATFSTSNNDIKNRSRTTGVSWSSTDLAANGSTYHATPSLVSDVQAVVNRAGWASGNDMCVIIVSQASNLRDLTVESYENTGTNPPALVIVYSTGGAPACTGSHGSAGFFGCF
jgi:hypothetical protein